MTSKNLSEGLDSFAIPGTNYGYTGANLDTLTSFRNTIAMGLVDESGSTRGFSRDLEIMVQEIVKSLRDDDNASSLLYSHVHFDRTYKEIHGYKELLSINPVDYDGCWQGGANTTLYDSETKAIKSIGDYGKLMAEKQYVCNGFLYILTDGMDYGSTLTENDVKQALEDVFQQETLESLMTILIGFNESPDIQKDLKEHATNCGFTQYVAAKDTTAKTLSKITGFISKSLSSQSQSLGTGGPSQPLQF